MQGHNYFCSNLIYTPWNKNLLSEKEKRGKKPTKYTKDFSVGKTRWLNVRFQWPQKPASWEDMEKSKLNYGNVVVNSIICQIVYRAANLYCLFIEVSGNVWREDSYVLSLMSPLSLFKRNSTLLPGTEVIVWGRFGSPLVNILFRTKPLSLVPLSWDMDCLLTLWLTLLLVLLVTVAVCLIFWSLSFPKEVSCTTAYIYS